MKASTLILDVDGVIFDSNQFKEENIYQAAFEHADEQIAASFTRYFTGLNGIPRETKIRDFFVNQPQKAEAILATYNALNESGLDKIEFTINALEVIRSASEEYNLIALSGGAETEVKELFQRNKIDSFFQNILGGPKTKMQHLAELNVNPPVYFIGDSKVDYEAAVSIGAHFVFMWQYTQFSDWENFFSDNRVDIIKNLTELNQLIQKSNIENA